MSYKITIIPSGFVTHDMLKPVGFSGEMNSRRLQITHPRFKECYYQLLVKRYDGLYTLGVDDNGIVILPGSLLRTATELECMFVAMSNPDSIENDETDTFIFQSMPFKLTVAPGLDIGGMSAIPPYEQLQYLKKENDAAKGAVDHAIAQNVGILTAIEEAIANARKNALISDIEEASREAYQRALEEIDAQHFEEFKKIIGAVTKDATATHRAKLDLQYQVYKKMLGLFVDDILENAKADMNIQMDEYTDQFNTLASNAVSTIKATAFEVETHLNSYKDQLLQLFGENYDEFVQSVKTEINRRFIEFTTKCQDWHEEYGCVWDFDMDCDTVCFFHDKHSAKKEEEEPETEKESEEENEEIRRRHRRHSNRLYEYDDEQDDEEESEDDEVIIEEEETPLSSGFSIEDYTGDNVIPADDEYEVMSWTLREVGGMTKSQLARFVGCMIKHMLGDIKKCSCTGKSVSWSSAKIGSGLRMSQGNQTIGG